MAGNSHNDNCLFMLDVEEVFGEERIHNQMETEKGETKDREKGENDERTSEADS